MRIFLKVVGFGHKAAALGLAMGAFIALPYLAMAKNPEGVAVVIGNRNYGAGIPAVDFAHRDAAAMKAYVENVLGFHPDNIIHIKDANKADLEAVFGNHRSHKGKLWRFAAPDGASDIVVFYSGHGVPGQSDKRGYLLPANAHPDTAEINGYSIDVLYQNLHKIKAKSRTVLLDACFSGESPKGMLIKKASAVVVSAKPVSKKMQQTIRKNTSMTILTAAGAGQLASWDEKNQYGLFTRHFLDAAYGAADADKDGKVAVGEIKSYLDRHMTRHARRHYGREQKASLVGNKKYVLAHVPTQQNWRGGTTTAVIQPVQTDEKKTVPVKDVIVKQPAIVKEPAVVKTKPDTTAQQKVASRTPVETRQAPVGLPGLNGIWKNKDGVQLTIENGKLEFDMVMGDAEIHVETTVDATGKIKKAYAAVGRNFVYISGSLDNLKYSFSSYWAGRGDETPFQKVKNLDGTPAK